MKPNSKILLIILCFIGISRLAGQEQDSLQKTRTEVSVFGETTDMQLNYFTKWIDPNPDKPFIGNSLFMYEKFGVVNVGDPQSGIGPIELLRVNGKVSLMEQLGFNSSIANITWGEGIAGNLVFIANDSETSKEVMTLVGDDGSVGIGTPEPSAALEVVALGGQNFPSIISSGIEKNKILIVPFLGEGGFEQKSSCNYLAKQGDAGIFWTDADIANDNAGLVIAPFATTLSGIRIDNYGNVGIGVKSPLAKLHIDGKTMTKSFTLYDTQYPPQDGFVLLSDAVGNARWSDASSFGLWELNPNEPENIYYANGNVGIGTINTFGYRLAVNGKILTDEVMVMDPVNWTWPDYVLKPGYILLPLPDLETFIKSNQHLPDVPSETEVTEKGYGLAEMNGILLKKVEELTLYIIEQQKAIEAQQAEILEIKKLMTTQ